MPHSHARLAELREIGWALWNPIGLEAPPDTPADEYDHYLVCAAGMIEGGSPDEEVVGYLIHSAEVTMGMAPSDRVAAGRTSAALRGVLAAPLLPLARE